MSLLSSTACSFLLSDHAGNELARGEAEVRLEKESFTIHPKLGQPILLSLVDIVKLNPADYRLEISLAGGARILITDLGQRFDDLVSLLTDARNQMILKFLLISESPRKVGVACGLTHIDASGKQHNARDCVLSLYDTCIVLMPPNTDPIRIHYSDIAKSEAKDYALSLVTESGDSFAISGMGQELDSVVLELSNAMNALDLRTQSLVKLVVPEADPIAVMRLARILKDGRAARKMDIDSISQAFWPNLEKKLESTPVWESYQYLKSIGRPERSYAGIKRGLMGELTGDYIWFMVPIYGGDQEAGNALALESVRLESDPGREGSAGQVADGESSSGGATYFFRIAGRQEYGELSAGEMDARVDRMVRTINQLMLDINFRREPIFLSDEQLQDPRFSRYRYALQKIETLRELRRLFIGRVVHSDQWRSDVQDLLSFIMSTKDESAKWKRL
jgi:hypothetical protein